MRLKNFSSLILIILGVVMIFLCKRIKNFDKKNLFIHRDYFYPCRNFIAGSEFINGFNEEWNYYSV